MKKIMLALALMFAAAGVAHASGGTKKGFVAPTKAAEIAAYKSSLQNRKGTFVPFSSKKGSLYQQALDPAKGALKVEMSNSKYEHDYAIVPATGNKAFLITHEKAGITGGLTIVKSTSKPVIRF